MALMRFTEDGPDPPLRPYEYVQCRPCGAIYTAEDIEDSFDDPYGEGIWDVNYDRAVCPSCGVFESFIRRRAARRSYAWSDRWGRQVARSGVTPMPRLLSDFLPELGLDATDLGLLQIYESYRRLDEAVFPSQATVAKKANLAERTVRTRLGAMVARGLCERERSHRRDGSRGTDRVTRDGLTAALALIADNLAADRTPTAGLAELLAALERHARMPGQNAPGRCRREAALRG